MSHKKQKRAKEGIFIMEALYYPEQLKPDNQSGVIRKSNALIHRVGKTSLMSEKILIYALKTVKEQRPETLEGTQTMEYFRRVKERTNFDFSRGLVSEISNTELRKAIGNKNGSYYKLVDDLMNHEVFKNSWNIMYNDEDMILSANLVSGTAYDKKTGKMYIKWNSDVKHLIYNLQVPYTELNEKCLLYNHLYSLTLYQILKNELTYHQAVDRKKNMNTDHVYVFDYEFSKLKFELGIMGVNTSSNNREEQRIADLIKAKQYEEAERAAIAFAKKEKGQGKKDQYVQLMKYADVKRYALTKAFYEINGFEEDDNETYESFLKKCKEYEPVCEIRFFYEPLKSGRGNKVNTIRFYVDWSKNFERIDVSESGVIVEKATNEPVDEATMDELIDKIADIIPVRLKLSEYKVILKEAQYNISKVEQAVEVMKSKKGDINDVTAWMISAIRNGYQIPTSIKKDKEYSKKNSFTDVSQRTYDYDQLELLLLNSQPDDKNTKEESVAETVN